MTDDLIAILSISERFYPLRNILNHLFVLYSLLSFSVRSLNCITHIVSILLRLSANPTS